MRVNLYSGMHKAQRTRMFELATKIGKADFSDRATTEEIRAKLLQIIENVRRHAHYEEEFIHPLLAEGEAEVKEALQDLHEEHVKLEPQLNNLEKLANNDLDNSTSLYADFNRLIGSYLIHIDKEESLQESFLWTYFDDERLAEAMEAARKATPPQEAKENLEFLLPCLNVSEATGFLRTAKLGAPPPAFQAACRIAEEAFSPEDWQKIAASLN